MMTVIIVTGWKGHQHGRLVWILMMTNRKLKYVIRRRPENMKVLGLTCIWSLATIPSRASVAHVFKLQEPQYFQSADRYFSIWCCDVRVQAISRNISDKELTHQSGLLDLFKHGDSTTTDTLWRILHLVELSLTSPHFFVASVTWTNASWSKLEE